MYVQWLSRDVLCFLYDRGHDWKALGTDARGLFVRGGICLLEEAAGVVSYTVQSGRQRPLRQVSFKDLII